jgi:putative membrane protein
MQTLQELSGVLFFVLYFAASIAMLAAFTWLYVHVTPYDEAKEISEGKLAPAIAMAGALLGFTFPLLVASYTHSSLVGFLAWGVLACLVQLFAFWVLHGLLPRVIETNNVAGATCFAAASVCVGLMNAASFIT